MSEEIRWRYRFTNFARAYALLREPLEQDPEALSDLEREGVVQRFEYTFELAWKTLKDRLEHDGATLATVTPRAVIREAFQAKLIDDGETWTDMLADRNKVSHTYDNETFLETIRNIRRRYLAVLGDLHERLGQESSDP